MALMTAVGLGFAACDEFTLPNPPVQSNPGGDQPVFDASELVFTSLLNDNKLDLKAAKAEGVVKYATYSIAQLPEGYQLAVSAVLSADAGFAVSDTVVAELGGNDIVFPVDALNEAFIALNGYSPEAKKVYGKLVPYAVNGTNRVRLGNLDSDYLKQEITVTPVGYDYVIEDEYYLVGNFCDWDVAKGIRFTKLEEGNPYDYPNFMAAIFVEEDLALAGGCEWKVVPGSAVKAGNWAGAWGVDAEAGKLVAAPEAQTAAGVITQPGSQSVKIDMRALTYEIAPAYEMLWVPGMGSHTTNFDKILPIPTNDYIHYEGSQYLYANFWFTAQAALKGISFRPDGDAVTDANGVVSGKMHYDPTSSQKMKVPSAGLYYIKANVIDLTWSITPIPVINIIGDFNGWDTVTAPALTPNKKKNVWTIEDVELSGGFKFCVSNAWTYSYGGSMDNIVQNGGNLNAEAGKYDVELHFDVYPNYVKLTAK